MENDVRPRNLIGELMKMMLGVVAKLMVEI
jgi:hypothetical protein